MLKNTKSHTNKKGVVNYTQQQKNTTLLSIKWKKGNMLPQIQYLLEIEQNPAAEALPTAGIE